MISSRELQQGTISFRHSDGGLLRKHPGFHDDQLSLSRTGGFRGLRTFTDATLHRARDGGMDFCAAALSGKQI
jgi:hypothetical protein